VRKLSAFLCVICIGLVAGSAAFARDARLDYLVGQGLVTEDQVAAAETEGPSNWMAKKAYDVMIEGYVQAWWAYKDGGDPDNAFSIKRSELKLAGKLGEGWTIVAAFDPASSSILKDCYVGYTTGDATIKMGHLKPPLVLENMTSSSSIDTINRSKIAGKVNERDIGAYLDYVLLEGKAGISAAVTNGTGSHAETNDAKDYIACVWTKPFKGSEGPADGLMLRAAASMGDQQELDEEDVDLGDFQRTIWIATVQWVYSPFKVQGEYVNIDQDLAGGGSKSTDGWYLLALYELPLDSITVAPLAKYEQLDGSGGGDWITLGVRLSFVGTDNVKISVNYIIESLDEGRDADQFILQVQAKF
jgi:hypothetical protein